MSCGIRYCNKSSVVVNGFDSKLCNECGTMVVGIHQIYSKKLKMSKFNCCGSCVKYKEWNTWNNKLKKNPELIWDFLLESEGHIELLNILYLCATRYVDIDLMKEQLEKEEIGTKQYNLINTRYTLIQKLRKDYTIEEMD